jgi:hypothetical protein
MKGASMEHLELHAQLGLLADEWQKRRRSAWEESEKAQLPNLQSAFRERAVAYQEAEAELRNLIRNF